MGPRLGLNCMYIKYTHCPFLVSQMKRTWVVLCSFFWQSNLCLKQIQITMYNDWWYCAVIANLQIEKISNTILCFWAGCFQKLPNDQATRPFQPILQFCSLIPSQISQSCRKQYNCHRIRKKQRHCIRHVTSLILPSVHFCCDKLSAKAEAHLLFVNVTYVKRAEETRRKSETFAVTQLRICSWQNPGAHLNFLSFYTAL